MVFTGIMEIINYQAEKNSIPPRVYNEKKVDGIIVLGQLKTEYLKMIEDINLPVVFFDFYVKDSKTDSIVADNFSQVML
jgi:LacI family transcriptional regulator